MNIVLICTEHSGENLLHNYLKILHQIYPQAHIYCQTSYERFCEEGWQSHPQIHFLADRSLCSVMGFIEPLKRLYPLWCRIRFLKEQIQKLKPHLVIGFDGPDFCLRIEAFAKKQGSYVIHVVSPSVWAWRPGRVFVVEKSAHELHHLFAFEKDCYAQTKLIVRHIGHPLIRKIELCRRDKMKPEILLLAAGSRTKEITVLLPLFIKWARSLLEKGLISSVVISRVSSKSELYPLLTDRHMRYEDSFESAVAQADFAIACSGTATLEIAAQGCPLLVTYALSSWKKMLLSFFIQTPFIALPNILAQKEVIPEFLGDMDNLEAAILEKLQKSLSAEHYPSLCCDFYDTIKPIMEAEKQVCLRTLLESALSSLPASMRQDVVL